MFRSIRKMAAAAMVFTMVLSSAAYADVIYAPGVVTGEASSDAVSAGPAGDDGAITVSPESVPSDTASGSGYLTIGGGDAITIGGGAADTVDAVTMEGPGGTPAEAVTIPQDTSITTAADLVPAGQDGVPFSGETSIPAGDGSVQVDPIIGYAPFVNAVMVLPSGIRTLGFNSNMDVFSSPEEGLTGLWARLEYGIGDCFYRVFTNEHG